MLVDTTLRAENKTNPADGRQTLTEPTIGQHTRSMTGAPQMHNPNSQCMLEYQI